MGVIEITTSQSLGQTREHTLSTVSFGTQPMKVKLPQLNLPSFNNDPKKCVEFWNCFFSATASVNIPAVQKFSYLLTCLKGRAYAGIAMTNNNCKTAVQLLKK